MYEIEKNVPVPTTTVARGRKVGPFLTTLRALEIGDSFRLDVSGRRNHPT